MKRYKVLVRVSSQTVYTYVYAETAALAKLIAERQFGVGNVISTQLNVWCYFVWLRKYVMRIHEILIKPKPPLTPQQARINSLKQNVERDKQQLQGERDRQRKQRDAERLRKLRIPSTSTV